MPGDDVREQVLDIPPLIDHHPQIEARYPIEPDELLDLLSFRREHLIDAAGHR
jgi:hypothetical protein